MKTIYVNDAGRPTITAPQREPLVGRDLYLYRQMHAHDEGMTMEKQEAMQKKKTVGREKWLERILKQAYGDK